MAISDNRRACGRGERGGSRLNFLIVMIVIGVVGYSAYHYAPVEFNAYRFKDFMQETVDKASYPPGQSNEWVAQQLRAAAPDYNLPPDINVNVQRDEGRITARVQWTQPVKLPAYVYQYKFDHTVRSSGFISQQ
ncbi:MAG TPA: hypothetical protein VFA21_12275 [Pyrinomonadaceae bacterium]|jgi:hypothetical protein|nr:hypothetical protein [Pyrinomonadaceae bacterium]